MICKPCGRGADIMRDLPRVYAMDRELIAEEARKAHGECRGGSWCDCQHRIQLAQMLAAHTFPVVVVDGSADVLGLLKGTSKLLNVIRPINS